MAQRGNSTMSQLPIPYRDQTPGGGRFMCTVCGHVSKRPVLDVPGVPAGAGFPGSMTPGASLAGVQHTNGVGTVSGLFGSKGFRGWSGRGWPDRGGWVPSGKGWTGTKAWIGAPGGVGWGSGSTWGTTNWPGRSWTGAAYWGVGAGGNLGGMVGVGTGNWSGNGYGIYAGESCVAGEVQHGGFFFVLCRGFSFLFYCLKKLWRKLWRGDRAGDDGSMSGGRRGGQRKGDESGVAQGSRVDKARRKAEEKRQARLEREQLEAEEKRQREEVARLVEERRRQRDEMIEAEKESEREAAAERERELKRERDAERRRQEKIKEKDRETKANSDLEEKKKKEKDTSEKKCEGEKKLDAEKRPASQSTAEVKKPAKVSRGVAVDVGGCKGNEAPVKVGSAASGKFRYFGSTKGAAAAPAKSGSSQTSSLFWGKGLTGLNSGSKVSKSSISTSSPSNGSGGLGSVGKATDSSYSAWNRMPWTKVWGKSTQTSSDGKVGIVTTSLEHCSRGDTTKQCGVTSTTKGLSFAGVSDVLPHSTAEPKQQTQSWQQLFTQENVVLPPSASEVKQPTKESVDRASPSLDSGDTDSYTSLVFGHGIQGPILPQHPLGTSVQSPTLSSPPIPSSLSSNSVAGVGFGSPLGPHPPKSPLSPHAAAPTPIGKPQHIQSLHPPVSGPLQMPTLIQMPVSLTGQSQSHLLSDHFQKVLEPWQQAPLPEEDSCEGPLAGDKWEMWDTPQLDQSQLPSLGESLSWNCLGTSFINSQKDSLRTVAPCLEPENQLPTSLFSPQQHIGVGCSGGEFLTPLPVGNSHSLWSGHSAFESATRILIDPDAHHRVPPEFVDCITQEVMLDPVITADGHSYERAAIERWLQTHDTSPRTGEVLPPPPGGYGSGVDKTLRPNHILRGQIIDYRENMARLARGQDSRFRQDSISEQWSAQTCLGLGSSTWSSVPNPDRSRIGGFYTTPSAHSVWSFDRPQNSVPPPL